MFQGLSKMVQMLRARPTIESDMRKCYAIIFNGKHCSSVPLLQSFARSIYMAHRNCQASEGGSKIVLNRACTQKHCKVM